jgi:DNA-binding transcriptional MerR regulator
MRTVKQVSDLTGISVRTLHYYDEIGLLKPSQINDAGYRYYNEEALETLQQILFFKELDIPLKEVKEIMSNSQFNKMQALKKQEKLLVLKRDRLNGLIELINKTLKGDNTMSFKEFDMSEYFNVLEEFKKEHEDMVFKHGDADKFNEVIEKVKSMETEIAEMAIKQYGSIEKYAQAVKQNLNNSTMLSIAEQYDKFKKDCMEENHPKLKGLYKKLVSDLSKNPSSKEAQQIAAEITDTVKSDYDVFRTDMGDDHWYYMVQNYLVNPEWIKAVDEKFGTGSSKFIGEALMYSLGDKQPKLITLYKKLTSDLSKNPSSKEIQQIVAEIIDVTEKDHEAKKIDMGENYWGFMTENYLSKPMYIKVLDDKYGTGASNFIGEALKLYFEK